eukprot:10364317-Prorocentrum_lima.AAC.1
MAEPLRMDVLGNMAPPETNHLNNDFVSIVDEAVPSANTCQNLRHMKGYAIFTARSKQNAK